MQIKINGLRQKVRIGVTEEERAFPQILLIDIVLSVDFTAASQSDDLSETVDYSAVCKEIAAYVSTRNWKLLEKFVRDLSEMVANLNSRIGKVEVNACKNVIAQVDSVSVSYCHFNEIKKV